MEPTAKQPAADLGMVWEQRFGAVQSILRKYNLAVLAEQAKDLSAKAHSQDLYIAFCGHFSAGKSTLVNALLGAEILPASPIPTTANVVEVRHGRPHAVVTKLAGEQIQFPLEDIEAIKQYCVTEKEVKQVTLYFPASFLPPHVVFLDTPGIDSTDEAHQLATEAVIFLSDVVFYIMDYNHVQSELNFTFAKELQDRGKRLYLVVNQIDKHIEFELDFEDYKESVTGAFTDWGVKPQAVYFTTLIEPDHPENEFSALQDGLRALFADRSALLGDVFIEEARELVRSAQTELFSRQQQERSEIEVQLDSSEDAARLRGRIEEMQAQFEDNANERQRQLHDLENRIMGIIRDARLFVFTTTELAADYLESLAPNFKLGWFSTAAKVTAERSARLDRFLQDLQEQVNSQLAWLVRDQLLSGAGELGLRTDSFTQQVDSQSALIEPEFLTSQVKSGAGGREYAYRYREDVSAAVKNKVRLLALQQLEGLKKEAALQSGHLADEFAQEMRQLKETLAAKEKLAAFDEQIQYAVREISDALGVSGS